jgi:thiol:disulfide interchange protein DsbD
MKKYYLSLISFLACLVASAQINNPVQWNFTSKKIADKTYELQLNATIGKGWHLYAQDAGDGPEPTKITFDLNPLVTVVGTPKEKGKLENSFDSNFNSLLKFYSNKVTFVQNVKLKSSANTVVKGTVRYMVCNDRQCLPPKDVAFSVKTGGK